MPVHGSTVLRKVRRNEKNKLSLACNLMKVRRRKLRLGFLLFSSFLFKVGFCYTVFSCHYSPGINFWCNDDIIMKMKNTKINKIPPPLIVRRVHIHNLSTFIMILIMEEFIFDFLKKRACSRDNVVVLPRLLFIYTYILL